MTSSRQVEGQPEGAGWGLTAAVAERSVADEGLEFSHAATGENAMKSLAAFMGVASLCALVSVSPAQAVSVMTFDGIPQCCLGIADPGSDGTWSEAGITATGNSDFGLGYHILEDSAQLNDGATGYPTAITFTMQGSFDAISFDLIPTYFVGYAERDEEGELQLIDEPLDNVLLTGIRDGIVVATDTFNMGELFELSEYIFSELFSNLDSLVIAAILPNNIDSGFCAPCAGFNIDNVTLSLQQPISPVPIPPSALLLLTALGLMSWRGVSSLPGLSPDQARLQVVAN
jgi:hypothetical protein